MLLHRQKWKAQIDNNKKAEPAKDGEKVPAPVADGEDLSGMDNDESYPGQINETVQFIPGFTKV